MEEMICFFILQIVAVFPPFHVILIMYNRLNEVVKDAPDKEVQV